MSNNTIHLRNSRLILDEKLIYAKKSLLLPLILCTYFCRLLDYLYQLVMKCCVDCL